MDSPDLKSINTFLGIGTAPAPVKGTIVHLIADDMPLERSRQTALREGKGTRVRAPTTGAAPSPTPLKTVVQIERTEIMGKMSKPTIAVLNFLVAAVEPQSNRQVAAGCTPELKGLQLKNALTTLRKNALVTVEGRTAKARFQVTDKGKEVAANLGLDNLKSEAATTPASKPPVKKSSAKLADNRTPPAAPVDRGSVSACVLAFTSDRRVLVFEDGCFGQEPFIYSYEAARTMAQFFRSLPADHELLK